MSKVLITGVNGYLGGHLANHLHNKGYEVEGVVRSGSSLREDLADVVSRVHEYESGLMINSLENIDSDWNYEAFYHVAALYSTKEDIDTQYDLMMSNVKYTSDVIAVGSAKSIPVIAASTFSAYTRNNEFAKNNLYSFTKLMGEMMGVNHAKYMTSIIMSDTYGPNDTRGKVHNLLHEGKIDELYSPGSQKMVLNHIEDVCEAFFQAHQLIKEDISNGVSRVFSRYDLMYEENEVTLNELIEALDVDAKCIGKIDEVEIPKGFNKIPGFEPKYNVKRDIKRVLEGS